MDARERAVQGWGYSDAAVTDAEVARVAGVLAARFPSADLTPRRPATIDDVALPAPRLTPPPALAALSTTDGRARCLHAFGRSYRDVVRAVQGRFPHPPDVVAAPRTPADVRAILEWCAEAGAQCVPFGGGTSVVGGVEPRDDARPAVTLQTRAMRRVVEVDRTSRAACIEAGATGPDLEQQLGQHGLTLRFFPQSFEMSTLGGWIATRAAGHFATGPTHIDDLVESVHALTPAGAWESRRLPGSGAGPSPDRMLLGSEGILGVITQAWVRVQERPVFRRSGTVRFPSFTAGAAAVRALAQSGLQPANCRLLDPVEALLAGAGDGASAVLVLGFESAHAPVESPFTTALEVCRHAGGSPDEARASQDKEREDAAGAWRETFLRAPYLRDALIALGMVVETFETAVTWDRFDALVEQVRAATQAAVAEVCGDGIVTCRTTHAYPDGAAPYFTVIAPARRRSEIAQWDAIKQAASDALLAAGGTITHHHAVGRDHRQWYDRQRPEPFAAALRAVKSTLDPAAILNPGVLVG